MFLTRDQHIACDVARLNGYVPSLVTTLSARNQALKGAVVSVAAIKDGARYNLRVVIKKTEGTLLSADKLTVVFKHQSPKINECVIEEIQRAPVLLKE